jgi:hypothetical protein
MRNLIIVGDSHVRTLRWAYDQGLINAHCNFVEVPGATSIGLRNPNSQTNAIEIFSDALLPPRRGVTPVIHLGEVDCGFVIWWRAAWLGESIEVQLKSSVNAYFEFVDLLKSAGYEQIILTGAMLPTIQDGQDWGEIANARRDVTASLVDRTALTLRYNRMIRQGAEVRGYVFVDISANLLNVDGKTIAHQFRHPDQTDHHVNPELVGPIWAADLNTVI